MATKKKKIVVKIDNVKVHKLSKKLAYCKEIMSLCTFADRFVGQALQNYYASRVISYHQKMWGILYEEHPEFETMELYYNGTTHEVVEK